MRLIRDIYRTGYNKISGFKNAILSLGRIKLGLIIIGTITVTTIIHFIATHPNLF